MGKWGENPFVEGAQGIQFVEPQEPALHKIPRCACEPKRISEYAKINQPTKIRFHTSPNLRVSGSVVGGGATKGLKQQRSAQHQNTSNSLVSLTIVIIVHQERSTIKRPRKIRDAFSTTNAAASPPQSIPSVSHAPWARRSARVAARSGTINPAMAVNPDTKRKRGRVYFHQINHVQIS